MHAKIANALRESQDSIRKLEELSYHLYLGKKYFELKKTISHISNFLLIFNPNGKFDLCRYWQKLEEQGFDPVVEYNKSIEWFKMHYYPSPENIFRIFL